MQPAFHHKVISGLQKVVVDANSRLLAKWEGAAESEEDVNVTHDISVMVLEIVLLSIFGEDYKRIAPPFRILVQQSARDLQFAQTFRPLRKTVHDVAARRRAERRTGMDFLGLLMASLDRDSGRAMPDGQLVTEIMTLIVAGHETTALTLNWAWYLLSRNLEVEEKLSCEIRRLYGDELPDPVDLSASRYLSQVLDETLRLYPPVWLITRKALNDDRLGEYFVPAGTEIYFSPFLIQRHPELWQDPDRFDPDRFQPKQLRARHPLAALPFSAGPRNCIGEALALFEMQIHFIMIAKRLRFRCNDDTPPELDLGVNLRNKHDFVMTPEIKPTMDR